MEIVSTIPELRTVLKPWRRAGDVISMVPTMGHLHRGHLSLIEMARAHGDRVVASIYVNPTQFDRPDDLGAYPRTLQNDICQLRDAGVDLVFTPDDKVIYPGGHSDKTRIDVPGMTSILCGAHRSDHFVGVATIVCKLFNIVQPDVAVFGEKDFQQLMIVRQITADLNLPVEIVAAPTWREANGLAMSSRNSHLTRSELEQAALMYQILCECAGQIVDGARDYQQLEAAAMALFTAAGFKPDFVSVRRCVDLESPGKNDPPESLVVLAAAYLGKARLIDNLQVSEYIRVGNIVRTGAKHQNLRHALH
jgi:pantoate--beta-alanine ligase